MIRPAGGDGCDRQGGRSRSTDEAGGYTFLPSATGGHRLGSCTGDPQAPPPAPPFTGVPATLEIYRARGHRRLAAATYASKCVGCLWGCEMTVEMIIDQWNPSRRRYRRETWCYGPKGCPLYVAAPTRKVPGRKGMSWTEEDWVDEQATAHRGEGE